MFINYRNLNCCSFIFIITFLSIFATSCTDDKDKACFLEESSKTPLLLRTSGNSLVLPCHIAHSKHSTAEWWYIDTQKSIKLKIYPSFPQVRPIALRFITSLTQQAKTLNETDILDASILLRHINIDDSGLYRCIIRPWSTNPLDTILSIDDSDVESLDYQVQITAPRLCQPTLNPLPCFSAMRTSSPTIIDAYQTAFLQCVVKSHNHPINVFWVVGDLSENNVLITDHLASNQYHGDKLRRVFPLSPFDYSLELSVNRTTYERTYSCVINGPEDKQTTLFSYIIRTIDIEASKDKIIPSHDTLNSEEINSLHENQKASSDEETETKNEAETEDEQIEETTATI